MTNAKIETDGNQHIPKHPDKHEKHPRDDKKDKQTEKQK